MKKILILLFILPLFNNVSAQDWKFNSNGGSIKGSFDGSNSPTQSFDEEFHIDPLIKTPDSKEKPGKDKPTPPLKDNYDGPAADDGWGENDTYSNGLYERKRIAIKKKEEERKNAFVFLNEVKKLRNSDCIDINQLRIVIGMFDRLTPYQHSVLGHEGSETLKQLKDKWNESIPLYNEYSRLALNIKNGSFAELEPKMMHQSYEKLNGYLKQFLSQEEFERTKVEYEKYEKNKALVKELEALNANMNDNKSRQEVKENKKNDANIQLALHKVRSKKTSERILQKIRDLEKIKPNNKVFDENRTYTMPSFIEYSKVGAMAIKEVSAKQKYLANTFGDDLIPKSERFDKFTKEINNIESFGEMSAKSFIGNHKESATDYGRTILNQLEDYATNTATAIGNRWVNFKKGLAVVNINSYTKKGVLNLSLESAKNIDNNEESLRTTIKMEDLLFKKLPKEYKKEASK